jgi:hypothetical protein
VRRDVIHVDTWLRKEVVILPILSLYTQQDAFTQSKVHFVILFVVKFDSNFNLSDSITRTICKIPLIYNIFIPKLTADFKHMAKVKINLSLLLTKYRNSFSLSLSLDMLQL